MTTFRVLDIETTGLDPDEGAEVIELGWTDYEALNGRLVETNSILCRSERPCPPDVLAIHHILPEDQVGCDLFDVARAEVRMVMAGDFGHVEFLVAHNAAFEQKFLSTLTNPEFQSPPPKWICTMKCAMRIWPDAPSFGNQALRYFLGLNADRKRADPVHRAGPDSYVTALLLARLLEKTAIKDLVRWTAEPSLMPTCPIGKFRGKKWPEVETGFLQWMLAQASMEPDLKWNAKRELDRRREVA